MRIHSLDWLNFINAVAESVFWGMRSVAHTELPRCAVVTETRRLGQVYVRALWDCLTEDDRSELFVLFGLIPETSEVYAFAEQNRTGLLC